MYPLALQVAGQRLQAHSILARQALLPAVPLPETSRYRIQVSLTCVLAAHSITGESDSTAGQPVAGIHNNGGTLNIDEQASLQTSVKQTTGETNVVGKLASSSVELEGGSFNVSGTAE